MRTLIVAALVIVVLAGGRFVSGQQCTRAGVASPQESKSFGEIDELRSTGACQQLDARRAMSEPISSSPTRGTAHWTCRFVIDQERNLRLNPGSDQFLTVCGRSAWLAAGRFAL
jgi:hypothetical protein